MGEGGREGGRATGKKSKPWRRWRVAWDRGDHAARKLRRIGGIYGAEEVREGKVCENGMSFMVCGMRWCRKTLWRSRGAPGEELSFLAGLRNGSGDVAVGRLRRRNCEAIRRLYRDRGSLHVSVCSFSGVSS